MEKKLMNLTALVLVMFANQLICKNVKPVPSLSGISEPGRIALTQLILWHIYDV
jgi:hypothetical protein